jgi:hypothetical protein
MTKRAINRRSFLGTTAAGLALSPTITSRTAAAEPSDRPGPVGEAKGLYPGRVVWVHDPDAIDWQGPDDGCWWDDRHANQQCIHGMLARAVCSLTGAATVSEAWDKLFRHLNQARGKGDVGRKPGEKIVIKPNWVGMIYREGNVDPATYRFIRRENYMNTAPQMILALLEQLTGAGVRQEDITVCDTLAYLVHEYHQPLARAFPAVRYEDYAGQFGRIQVQTSNVPLYWSCRPQVEALDFVPTCFAEADYVVNFANLKAHMGSGVTLCAKNHYGSLVRWPVQKGYYDMHPPCFSKQTGVYRALVDLMGHEHLGRQDRTASDRRAVLRTASQRSSSFQNENSAVQQRLAVQSARLAGSGGHRFGRLGLVASRVAGLSPSRRRGRLPARSRVGPRPALRHLLRPQPRRAHSAFGQSRSPRALEQPPRQAILPQPRRRQRHRTGRRSPLVKDRSRGPKPLKLRVAEFARIRSVCTGKRLPKRPNFRRFA